MAQKKPDKAAPAGDERYRKPYVMTRIKGVIAEAVDVARGELAHDFAQYVNDAVRMRLVNEGHWPPKAKPAE